MGRRLGSNSDQPECVVAYRRIDGNVYRNPTGRVTTATELAGFCGQSSFSACYHQQYLAKNPNGYCGIGGCGVPFKLAELQVGEKAYEPITRGFRKEVTRLAALRGPSRIA